MIGEIKIGVEKHRRTVSNVYVHILPLQKTNLIIGLDNGID